MENDNRDQVGRGLDILRAALPPFIERELKTCYQARWWREGIENALPDNVRRGMVRKDAGNEDRLRDMDVQALLSVMWKNWNPVFGQRLPSTARSYLNELREVRNEWAHQQSFSADDAYRALDTMARLLEAIGSEQEVQVRKLAREVMGQSVIPTVVKEAERPAKDQRVGLVAPKPDVPVKKGDFQTGRTYSRQQISDALGGSIRSYLPRVGNRVVCGCFAHDLNPKLPYQISFGAGPEVERAAEILVNQAEAVPVFIKKGNGAWEYRGLFRATRLSKDPALVARESEHAIRPVVGVIYLEEVK